MDVINQKPNNKENRNNKEKNDKTSNLSQEKFLDSSPEKIKKLSARLPERQENQRIKTENVLKKWRQIILRAINIYPVSLKNKKNRHQSKIAPPQNLKTKLQKPKKLAQSKVLYFRILLFSALASLFILIILGGLLFRLKSLVLSDEEDYLSNKGKVVKKIVQIIPYPSALIKTPCGWKSVSLADFYFDAEAITFFYQQKKIADKNFSPPAPDQINFEVYNQKLKNHLMKCFAKQKGVQVTAAELQTELEKTITQAGSEQALADIVKSLYNWNLETFKTRVLYVYILEKKLSEIISLDPKINTETKAKAQEIYQKIIKNPENFYYYAVQYSDDTETQHLGGDLNWIEKGQINPALEESAFSLKIGEVSDIIQTPAGYHIIKVANKKTTPEGVDQVRLSHILIKTQEFDHWLTQELNKCKAYKFI